MRMVRENERFEISVKKADLILNAKRSFPELVFRENYSKFTILHSYYLFFEDFFDKLALFIRAIDEANISLLVLKPDPKEYFFHHFGTYPLIEASVDDDPAEFVTLVQQDPGDSPADAIAYNWDELIIFGEDTRWAIYGNNVFELAVFACKDQADVELFSSFFADDTFDAKTAVANVFAMIWGDKQEGLETLKRELIKNYS